MNTLSIVLLASAISASPQQQNLLRYGDNTFAISQIPMLGLWHYEGTDPGDGRTRAPDFDFVGSGNWAGYNAKWAIRDSKLFLSKITAKRRGKVIRNDDILPGKSFPLHAKWFTGRINLAVGGYNALAKKHESVIVFHVAKGVVTKTTFQSYMEWLGEWNGLSPTALDP